MMRYRLLDTTRVYALEIDASEAERFSLGARHAKYYQRWLEQIDTEWSMVSPGRDRVPYFVGLNNVRAALEWCFGENGDVGTGIRLAAAALPIFQTMSLLSECHRWSERALSALPDSLRGSAEEMHLQAGLGNSSMYLHGEPDAARTALSRSFGDRRTIWRCPRSIADIGPVAYAPSAHRGIQNRPALCKALFCHHRNCGRSGRYRVRPFHSG